ncbi:MAG: Fic family protein [Gammaproteobacteria bacterium]|nr:Fic family protein [Gammaproteobacteria bacterium]MBU1655189.1 Fic family protein [Gammaproteobacteria bacterium]MBU1960000.1 Fic family protein [Gammaproteobacteria bacterium]
MADLLDFVGNFPQGVSAGEIERHLKFSRTTLNRRLKEALQAGTLVVTGKGPATRYHSADPLSALRAYFARPHTGRTLAPYREELLEPEPYLAAESVQRFKGMPAYLLNKRELGKFLIDFACASSVLEGGTYSLLDTQALIEYGEKSAGKPLADAFLVLNHKEAFEYLHDHMRLDSIFEVHDLLTNDHDLPALKEAAHFLPKEQRGTTREYTDVDIRFSTYLPPFRPGTGYIGRMLEKILATAGTIENPVQAAFYLLTRIAYLQPFQDGNKRTSRAMCNVPLIQAKLPPISFIDFGKQDYIVSMLAFYELGDTRLAERCFVDAYGKSISRLAIRRE